MPRAIGTPNIPKRIRAQILAEKNTQLTSVVEIAAKHGYPRDTITQIKNETVPPDVLAMAQRYERDFLAIAQANAVKAGLRTFEKINDLPADKAATVMEKNFNVAQTLLNRPTSIVQTQQSKVAHIIKITRKVAEMNGDTVEETLSVVMDLIEPELVEEVKRVILGEKVITS